MKKSDIILIGSIIVVGLALMFGVRLLGSMEEKNFVRVSVDGQEYKTVPLSKPQQIVVEKNGVHNVVNIAADGSVWMEEANCDNQDCVQQGTVSLENMNKRPLGNMIVCLPNRVVIELVAADQAK